MGWVVGWGPVSEAVRDLDTDRTDTLAPLGGWSVRVRCGAAGGELEAHAYTWGPRVVGPAGGGAQLSSAAARSRADSVRCSVATA